jgi:hypothetical protein
VPNNNKNIPNNGKAYSNSNSMVNSAGPNKKINLQANNNIQRPQQNYPQQNYQNNEGNS